tara:strand:- start:374 stop:865 length:492 start_codon:yes stop_codon:yes gene_type:complete
MTRLIGNKESQYEPEKNVPYKNFKRTKFYKNNKNKEVFYTLEDTCNKVYKLGKTDSLYGNMERRLKNYQTYWGNNFNIKFIRTFNKATTGSQYTIGGNPKKLVSNYENEVLKQLKNDKVKPVRGKEYFKSWNKIETAIDDVDKSLKNKMAKIKRNRQSERLKK